MGWDGSGNIIRTNGTNTGGTVWQDDADADVKIRADRHDTHDQDLADAIEQALNRNGENSPSTNINWGNHRITNLQDGNSAKDAATVGQVQSQIAGVAQASGTDALTASFSPALTSLTDKTTVYVRAAAANTSTTPTFAPNSLAAKTITKEGNQALVAGDIAGADHVIVLQYSSSNDVWELLNPASSNALFPNVDAQVTRTDEELNALATSGGGNFPNVDSDVTATDEDLNEWDGLSSNGGYESTLIDITGDGDFDSTSTNKVRIVRIGNMVWAAFIGEASHSTTSDPVTSLQTIPSHLRPNEFVINTFSIANNIISSMFIQPFGNVGVVYRDSSLQSTLASSSNDPPIVFWTLDS